MKSTAGVTELLSHPKSLRYPRNKQIRSNCIARAANGTCHCFSLELACRSVSKPTARSVSRRRSLLARSRAASGSSIRAPRGFLLLSCLESFRVGSQYKRRSLIAPNTKYSEREREQLYSSGQWLMRTRRANREIGAFYLRSSLGFFPRLTWETFVNRRLGNLRSDESCLVSLSLFLRSDWIFNCFHD